MAIRDVFRGLPYPATKAPSGLIGVVDSLPGADLRVYEDAGRGVDSASAGGSGAADGAGTMTIRAAAGKSKPTILRWQERYMSVGADGLLRDALRGKAFATLTSEIDPSAIAEASSLVVGRTKQKADLRSCVHLLHVV